VHVKIVGVNLASRNLTGMNLAHENLARVYLENNCKVL
jgi:hypothetical protein